MTTGMERSGSSAASEQASAAAVPPTAGEESEQPVAPHTAAADGSDGTVDSSVDPDPGVDDFMRGHDPTTDPGKDHLINDAVVPDPGV